MSRTIPVAALVLSLGVAACSTMPPGELGEFTANERLMAAVYSPARPAEDTARDDARKPLETIAFAGVAEGQSIAEISPGGGYYTRILAQAVGCLLYTSPSPRD